MPIPRTRISHVVPNHRAIADENTFDLSCYASRHRSVEYRRKHCENGDKVKRFIRKVGLFGTPFDKGYVWVGFPCTLDTIGQEINTKKVSGRCALIVEPMEQATSSASDIQNAATGDRAWKAFG